MSVEEAPSEAKCRQGSPHVAAFVRIALTCALSQYVMATTAAVFALSEIKALPLT
jgi:hypothetical protein